jgi:mRNA interferase RelE/StbE
MSTGGGYEVKIKSSAKKDMISLPKETVPRIVAAIRELKNAPRPQGCKKLQAREEYRIREGDYRILYLIDDRLRVVEITSVAHRKDAYK